MFISNSASITTFASVSVPKDGYPGIPPPILISADGFLQEAELMRLHPLERAMRKLTNITMFKRPKAEDMLFDENFHHIHKGSDCSGYNSSGQKEAVSRPPRRDNRPYVHRGLILSGNGMRDFTNALCCELEAASIMDEIPCLVVRGICEYADTHKQNDWHYYAALLEQPMIKHMHHLRKGYRSDR
ncbi:hypothetical protein BJX65DRAFT_300609 [Aspergillus insuetus]